ncbi:MAG: T9SS type A sorting domain-containing protein [Lentimicrobium sp.]|nr:T9SS type A sorting domain-containing protein [Lentimicrobium sp.]
MKTKYLITISIIVFVIFSPKDAYLQNYLLLPDSGAVWLVQETNSEMLNYHKLFYPNSNQDTIIDGIVYQKLYSRGVFINDPWPNPEEPYFWGPIYYGACRSDDSGRSYLVLAESGGNFANEEILFMDLTVEKGDTLWQLPTYSSYDLEYIDSDLVVDSIDYVESGALVRKRVFLRDLNPPFGMDCPFIWVEGIGNIASGLLNAVGCGFQNIYFECMSVSDTVFAGYLEVFQEPYTGVCDFPFTDNVDQERIVIAITAYPNPASDYVVFEMQKAVQNSIITIFDITGRPVAAFPLTGEKTVWETAGVKPGVYLYKLQTPDGFGSGKLLLSP